MRLLTKQVFEFHELSDKAKQAARQAYVEQPDYPCDDWWTFDDFVKCGKCLGIEVEMTTYRRGSKEITEPMIYFELHRQGAVASFKGMYIRNVDAVKDITEHAPEDKVLIGLAERLTALQVQTLLLHNDQLCADIDVGRNLHSMSMDINVYSSSLSDGPRRCGPDGVSEDNAPDEHETDAIVNIIRAFADWIYKELGDQYDYYFSNDYVDSCLEEAEFDESGTII